MDDRRVRRPPGALRDNLLSILMAVSVVVATGTVPASAAAAPVPQAVASQAAASQAAASQGHDGPADATTRREVPDAQQDVTTVDTARTVQRAAAAVLAEAARLDAARLDAARLAEATQLAEAARLAEAQLAEARAVEAEQAAARAAAAAEAAQVAQTVTQVQQALLTLGYQHVGPADGIAGRRTTAAIKQFQADAGHPVSGAATAETLTQLLEKVDAGWRRPAPATPARPSAQPTTPGSPAGAPAVASPAATAPVWTSYVANTGNQATIDLCAGGLTSYRGDDGKPYFTVPYLTIHNNCGGAPILKLTSGDVVAITGGGVDGSYRVVDSRDVKQGSTTTAVAGLSGDIYLQTCYFNSTTMRIVGAVKVS